MTSTFLVFAQLKPSKMSVDYAKLKTNLNLIMHRLKLVEKKKMELNQKARRTIGEFLNAGKVDRARIRVEQIIREDYVVESMDLVESYCDFLLSRFGQIQTQDTVDDGLSAAVSSLIWVTPLFENDVPELKVIADQLGKKYGKQYVQAVRENSLKSVNETLVKKMSVQVPSKILVEKYLVEIAKDQKIDYKPDPKVMKEQEALGSNFGGNSDDPGSSGGGGGGQRMPSTSGQSPAQSGFNLIDLGDHYPRNPITQPSYNPYGQPPPLPSEPPLGHSSLIGPSEHSTDAIDASAPIGNIPIGFNLPSDSSSPSSNRTSETVNKSSANAPLNNGKRNPESSSGNNGQQQGGTDGGPPPNYDSVVNKPSNQTQYFSFGPDSSFAPQQHRTGEEFNDTLPELPPVPLSSTNDDTAGRSALSPDDDFEDLTRRFEELKNKTA